MHRDSGYPSIPHPVYGPVSTFRSFPQAPQPVFIVNRDGFNPPLPYATIWILKMPVASSEMSFH